MEIPANVYGPLVVAVCLGTGGVIDRLVLRALRQRHAKNDIWQQMVWAMIGKDATQWSPRVKGVIEMVQDLAKEVGAVKNWTYRHDEFHERKGHETMDPPGYEAERKPEGG